MHAWAEVDSFKESGRARIAARDEERRRLNEAHRHVSAERFRKQNIERWFRELSPELAHALVLAGAELPHLEMVANDWLLEHGFDKKAKRPTREPSNGEVRLIVALKSCRFAPASAASRFAREIDPLAVTDRQIGWLRHLVRHFRRQIPADMLDPDDRHLVAKKARR